MFEVNSHTKMGTVFFHHDRVIWGSKLAVLYLVDKNDHSVDTHALEQDIKEILKNTPSYCFKTFYDNLMYRFISLLFKFKKSSRSLPETTFIHLSQRKDDLEQGRFDFQKDVTVLFLCFCHKKTSLEDLRHSKICFYSDNPEEREAIHLELGKTYNVVEAGTHAIAQTIVFASKQ